MKFLTWVLVVCFWTPAFAQQKDSNGSSVITLLCDNKIHYPVHLKIDLKNELFWFIEGPKVLYAAEPIAYFNENKVQLTDIFVVDRINGSFISASVTRPCSRAPFPEITRRF